MADWTLPTLTSSYQDVLNILKARDTDAAVGFDPALVTPSNLSTNTIRWSSANSRWEKKNVGGTWDPLAVKYLIDVDTLDGNHGSYFLDWNNFTNLPVTFPATAHTHDDRYFTETEADARYGASIANNGNTLQLLSQNATVISSLTVAYATSAGDASTVGGFNVNQNLRSTDSVTFNNITVTGTVDGRDVATDGAKLDGIEAGADVNPTASEILTDLQTVDGSGSGLDADQLDGQEGSFYRDASNLSAGTIPASRLPLASDTVVGAVEKSTSAENVAGTATNVFPDVEGVKEMIDEFSRTDLLETIVVNNDATLELTAFDNAKYSSYFVTMENLEPATDDVGISYRTSSDGGLTYDTTTGDYSWHVKRVRHISPIEEFDYASDATNAVRLVGTFNVGNAAGESGVNVLIRVIAPGGTGNTYLHWSGGYDDAAGYGNTLVASARRLGEVNAIQFFANSGNLLSGVLRLHGIRS